MANILILNGPNLNLLGKRQPEVYGSETLADIATRCEETAAELDINITFIQTNSETEIIEEIQAASSEYDGIVINGAGYTHTSVAMGDALLSLDIPIIEVHLSNIFKRETFRHNSYITPAAQGVICGLGSTGYQLSLRAIAELV